MTEQQLREKLQFAYGNMPDATRAAFEHSLTHHRAPETHRSIGLSRMMRIVITAVLMALMLTAVCGAAVHQAVTSRRTTPAKRERRKRSAQGASTN